VESVWHNETDNETVMKVAIIGGGVAGIGCAKVFKKYGFECTIYEKSDRIGGIWNTGYLSLPIQSFGYQYHVGELSIDFG
jgi:cation diffusion facilitator CzcD-associated flavoprotein CzcO